MAKEMKIIAFKLIDDEYGFEIEYIQEIRKIKRITYIPQSPDFVEGVIKLRGRVVPLINLRKRLGLPAVEYGKYTKVIIVNLEYQILGVIVDSVTELLTISKKNIEHPDSVLTSVNFLKGVGKIPGRMVLIVDIGKVFSLENIKSLSSIERCDDE